VSAFHLELLCLRGCLIFRYMTIVKATYLRVILARVSPLQFELTDLRPLMAQNVDRSSLTDMFVMTRQEFRTRKICIYFSSKADKFIFVVVCRSIEAHLLHEKLLLNERNIP